MVAEIRVFGDFDGQCVEEIERRNAFGGKFANSKFRAQILRYTYIILSSSLFSVFRYFS